MFCESCLVWIRMQIKLMSQTLMIAVQRATLRSASGTLWVAIADLQRVAFSFQTAQKSELHISKSYIQELSKTDNGWMWRAGLTQVLLLLRKA